MTSQYFVRRGTHVSGPLTARKLKELAISGRLAAEDEISQDEQSWVAAARFRGLRLDVKSEGPPSLNPLPERPFDVFISHSSQNKLEADTICGKLEALGIRCWIAPRNILPGTEWAEGIIVGIDASRIMVLIFSEHANDSPQVRREVERAMNRQLPIIPFRVQNTLPTRALEYCLGNTHWLDAFEPPLERHVEYLSSVVRQMLGTGQAARRPISADVQAPRIPSAAGKSLRLKGWLGAVAGLLILGLIVAWAGGFFQDVKKKVVLGEQAHVDPLTAPFTAGEAGAAQAAWAKSLGRDVIEKNSIGMELVLIPPGKFTMGSPQSELGMGGQLFGGGLFGLGGQQGQHRDDEDQVAATLTRAFYLGKTEVTQGQWEAVMGTTPWKGETSVREGQAYAASYISWDSAREFCRTLSQKEGTAYRLPTEAEWEFACRGGTSTRYSFGNDESRLGEFDWFDENANNVGEDYPHSVGQKKANPFGLYDMHGNVWEWCEDTFADKLPGGTDPLLSHRGSQRVNRRGGWSNTIALAQIGFGPFEEQPGPKRVYRGGSWSDEASNCRSASRFWNAPSDRHFNLGFRVALSSGK